MPCKAKNRLVFFRIVWHEFGLNAYDFAPDARIATILSIVLILKR